MNLTATNIKLFIGIMLFATWVALVVLKVPDSGDIITAIKLALAGLGCYHLNGRANAPSPPDQVTPPSSNQSGFASPLLLGVISILVLTLTGCAGFQQAVSGYESAAIVSLRAAEDNNIRMWAANACGTPFSAAIRNPQIVPALKALCLPAGADSSPATLLEVVPGVK